MTTDLMSDLSEDIWETKGSPPDDPLSAGKGSFCSG